MTRVEDHQLRYGLVVYSLRAPGIKRMLVCPRNLPTEWTTFDLFDRPPWDTSVFCASFERGHAWQTDDEPSR